MWRLVPPTLPTVAVPGIDARVLIFAGALTLVTAIVFGLAPLVHAGRPAALTALREGGRSIGGRGERLRGALAVAEIGASVVLLVAAGLLVRALWTVQGTDPGFRAAHLELYRRELERRRLPAPAAGQEPAGPALSASARSGE